MAGLIWLVRYELAVGHLASENIHHIAANALTKLLYGWFFTYSLLDVCAAKIQTVLPLYSMLVF